MPARPARRWPRSAWGQPTVLARRRFGRGDDELDVVAQGRTGRLEGGAADADAQAAAGDEHRAAGEVGGIEAAGHSCLAAAPDIVEEVAGDVDDRQAAGPVLAPLTNAAAERHCHDA